MTRDEKIAEAVRLYAEGWTDAEIGERFGVTKAAVWKWRHPEKVREWRAKDDPDRSRRRAWEQQHDRRPCGRCGRLRGAGAHRKSPDGVCRRCYQEVEGERVELRAARIVSWWSDGLTIAEIAVRLGWSKERAGVEIVQLRGRGYDLPYRRTPEQVERIRAGWMRARGEAA